MIKGILFPQSTSKVELFSWFDGSERTILCIFPIFFCSYIISKLYYPAVLGLKMTAIARPFHGAINECGEINTFVVINNKPSFDDHIREWQSETLFEQKNRINLHSRPKFWRGPIYPKFTVNGLKYSQHTYNYSTYCDFWKTNYKKSYKTNNEIQVNLPPPLGAKCR